MNRTLTALSLACLLAAALAARCRADGLVEPQAQAPEAPAQPQAPEAALRAQPPSLSASIVSQETQAPGHSATVRVQVKGLRLIDTSQTDGQAVAGQGHLQYKVDDNAPVQTARTTMTFDNLSPGAHSITVLLVGNDDAPLGPSERLDARVP